MARSRGGRPAARPAARSPPPPPSRPYSTTPTAPPPAQHAPPPAAPPPSYAPAPSSGGGMMSGLMGSVATGMALGTGSAMAHRAVDSAWGAFSGSGSVPAEPVQAQAAAQQVATSDHPCAESGKQFAECMSKNGGDMAACDYFFNAMQQCKMQHP